jgi:hypothetical protein
MEDANLEFEGPGLADECHYFGGAFNGRQIRRYTAHWRYAEVFCQMTLTGPKGHWKKGQLFEYALRQDRRARAAIDSRSAGLAARRRTQRPELGLFSLGRVPVTVQFVDVQVAQ